MGNLDFLEKKTKYAIGWDGILEGKETFTNKGFNNDDPADTWCKISEYFPKEGSFVNTVGPISSAHGFDYDLSIANCHDAIVSRFFSDKYETISIKFDIGTIIVVHCDIDKCTIPGRSNIQYNSITFPTEGWWIKATMNGVNPVSALGVLMTISTAPRFMFSGKGFTSPQKPYRYASRSFDSDDVISIFYDPNIIPDTNEAKSKGFNAICAPGDWNTKADIKLNKDLADIVKAGYNGCLNVYIYDDIASLVDSTPIMYRSGIEVYYDEINSINGLNIVCVGYDGPNTIYFNPSISREEYNMWANKYSLLGP